MNVLTVHLPTLALLVLAALFGHDALMAMGPHEAAAMAHHAHPRADHGDASHDGPEVTCHLTEGARLAPAGSEPQPSGTGALLVPAIGDMAATAFIAWQAPPVTRPDVARALLQVFLN